MSDKLEVGQKRIWNDCGKIYDEFKITAIGEKSALYLYENGEEYSESSEKILNQSKPYTPKKRYYLWDIEYAEGVYKTNYYINDKGLTVNGSRVSGKLLKKHENEFIEVDQ